MIKQNKRAKLYLIALLTLYLLGFVFSLTPIKYIAVSGCYFVLASMALAICVLLDSMNSKQNDDGVAKFKVFIISCICLVSFFAGTNILTKITTQTQLKTTMSQSQSVKWKLTKPKSEKAGYQEGYYLINAITSGDVKPTETIEPVYINKLELVNGKPVGDLKLYEYEDYRIFKTPFGKYKTHIRTYYELKD